MVFNKNIDKKEIAKFENDDFAVYSDELNWIFQLTVKKI